MCLWKMHRGRMFLNSSEGVALSFLFDARAIPLWSAMKNPMPLYTEYEIRHGTTCLLCGSLANIVSGVLKYINTCNVNRVCGKMCFRSEIYCKPQVKKCFPWKQYTSFPSGDEKLLVKNLYLPRQNGRLGERLWIQKGIKLSPKLKVNVLYGTFVL